MLQSRKKSNSYKNIGWLTLVIGLLLLFFGSTLSHFILIGVGLAFLVISVPLFRNYQTWGLGAEGEEKVVHYLNLPQDRFHVFHDLVLPKENWNIDHVVIGTNGVFVIETKNLTGTIACKGDYWTCWKIGQKGTPYRGRIGSPSKQAKRNAVFLTIS